MNEDKIKRFDFAKKPHKPSFLLSLAKHLLCFGDLKKRGAQIRKHDMEALEGKPYLLLVNHASMADFSLMLRATHPYPVNNVMTLEGFNTYTEPLMRSLGVLGKRKFVSDVSLVRNIKYCLDTLHTIFVLFPEARYSLDGCDSYIPDSLGGLIRLLRVPVVMLKIHGSFVSQPQWNKIDKKTYVEADMYPLFAADEVRALSVDEIMAKVRDAFRCDDFAWQYENKIRIDHPRRAEGLHALLYKCAACGAEGETDSAGDTLFCRKCGKRWRMDEYGRLHAETGETEFAHIPTWAKWERACVRKEVRDGTYRFEDEIRLETLPGSKRFYRHGKGTFLQTPEGITIRGSCYGKPLDLFKGALTLPSIHIEYDYLGRGDCADVSTPDDSYWCYFTKRDCVTKLSFATEEIFFLASERLKERKEASAHEKDR